MDIKETVTDRYILLSLEGSLDATQAPVVDAAIAAALAKGLPHLIFELGELRYVASMGLRCFIVANKMVMERGGKLAFFRLNDNVRAVFDMAGFLKLFLVTDTLEAALERIGGVT
ncbi:STAS domain-containing protein [Desulfovibrio sp. OttesenSCG-928-G11]|nr:STAS domain-containing protein [Desulfovibrio sp. OttesenSCG-928-G11]